jgi:hypothetical protein
VYVTVLDDAPTSSLSGAASHTLDSGESASGQFIVSLGADGPGSFTVNGAAIAANNQKVYDGAAGVLYVDPDGSWRFESLPGESTSSPLEFTFSHTDGDGDVTARALLFSVRNPQDPSSPQSSAGGSQPWIFTRPTPVADDFPGLQTPNTGMRQDIEGESSLVAPTLLEDIKEGRSNDSAESGSPMQFDKFSQPGSPVQAGPDMSAGDRLITWRDFAANSVTASASEEESGGGPGPDVNTPNDAGAPARFQGAFGEGGTSLDTGTPNDAGAPADSQTANGDAEPTSETE